MRCLLPLFWAALMPAADSTYIQKASVLRMQAAIERQSESVGRQMRASGGSLVATPWFMAKTAAPGFAPVNPIEANCDSVGEDELRKLISAAALKEGVNPLLLRAMINRESAARPCALSDKGAQGLMQLMPATQEYLGVSNAFDPAQNVFAGTRYIRELLGRYKGNVRLALAAYNAGPQRVDLGGNVPNIAETRAYVAAILADLDESEGQ